MMDRGQSEAFSARMMIQGNDPNAPPPAGEVRTALTVSNVIREIQVLKDKFKNDDEDHCEYGKPKSVLAALI